MSTSAAFVVEKGAGRLDVREVLSCLPHGREYIGSDWFENALTYPMYEKAARLIKPKSILEIGVLFGFGLVAFARGWPQVGRLVGFDNEQDVPGSLELAAVNVRAATGIELVTCRSMRDALKHVPFDLVHVDADHSTEGTALQAAFGWSVKPRVMLVDDYLSDESVKVGVRMFAQRYELKFKVWESYRGWAVFAQDLGALPDELS